MDEILRTRLKIINDSVASLLNSGNDILRKLKEDTAPFEEARIISSKLKAVNERFVSEMHNFYRLSTEPSADDMSCYTLIQIQAEELVAEIEARTQLPRQENVPMAKEDNLNVTSKLPRMELARFDGDILKWHQFWDQFSSNVDSRKINDVDKLLYLQSVLGGEAKQAIEGFDSTNKNYKIAVETLKERYGRPSVIIDAHYVALYRIETAGGSVKECRQILNEIERHLRVLESLGEDVNHNHLRVMIIEKFPEDLIYELRMKLGPNDESIGNIRRNLEYIISARETSNRFKENPSKLYKRAETFTTEALHLRSENSQKIKQDFSKRSFYDNRRSERPIKRFIRDETRSENKYKKQRQNCIFCDSEHFNDECHNVKTLQERKIKLKNRCYICFAKGHTSNECKSKRNCWHCGKYGLHNRALCPDKLPDQTPIKTLHVNVTKGVTILQTSTVNVFKTGDNSQNVNCRVLLDCGSQRSYITTKVAKILELPVLEETRLSVFTFGAKHPKDIESPLVQFDIVTRTNKTRSIYANVVPHITQSVPCPFGNMKYVSDSTKYNNIILADDGSREDQVDILLGNDYYYSFMSNESVEVEKDLFLVKTDFGWIWSGKSPTSNYNEDQLSVLTYFQLGKEIETHFHEPDLPLQSDNLKLLWDLETIGIMDSPKSSREEEAIKKFNDTTEYINNRYYVKWPWTEYPPTNLPVNFGLALGRLTSLLKRLDQDTIKVYDEVLQDQLNKGIIEEVTEMSLPNDHPIHYLPHHCILQEGKSTRLRIVYDASAKIKDNSSLNECLYRGPLMLEDLTGLIIRFRENRIGIVADVEKAFLQIGLQQNDKDVTRFLWIKDVNKGVDANNLQHLRFCRVPFGVISSPFLLNATVRHHLTTSKTEINKRLAEDLYVDNLVTGTQSVAEALSLYETAKASFEQLSMNLRQWNSNSKDFIDKLPRPDHDKTTDIIKILGIEWNTRTDELKLKPNFDSAKNINTKRGVLKVTASIYDPCGFVAPIVLPAKILLQELWNQKLKWDEVLPKELSDRWQLILSELNKINNFSIPRLYSGRNHRNAENETNYELHCFSDASMLAYAAVVYLRAYNEKENSGSVSFILGKSRLAPLKDRKDLQIPRLELLGAVIGNRLIRYVSKFIRLPIKKQILWVDSEIVINWVNSEKLLPPFVSRRINEIKQNRDLNIRYVPTSLNPADGATRQINTTMYTKNWLSGPKFLILCPGKWPKDYKKTGNNEQTMMQTFSFGEDFSNRVTTHDNETNMVERSEKNDEMQGIEEMGEESESQEISEPREQSKDNDLDINTIIKIQKEHFLKEVQGMKTDLTRSLDLFKDHQGLLRCGGRFKHAGWSDDKNNPILLPRNNDYTTKVIENVHKENYHIGVGHTLAIIRNQYWIIQGRSQVQKVLKNCMQCRKYGGGPYKMPLMPPLPAERVRYSTPFTFTGLDYFGPLKVLEGTTEKRWVCLFTCLAVRAIHMEVVKDLSSEECVMAIRRFIATRGLPQVITSDNATQFKLSSEVLISDYCIKNKISWRFIPELAPWFGGFYERLIGIVKNCLKRTLDKHLINHNQFCTVIKEIEAVVNTRPLTAVGQEFEQILTPADFLRNGGPLVSEVSDSEFLENATITQNNLVEGWKRGQVMLQEYVKMFTSQYLTSLREKQSAHKQSRIVVNRVPKVGDYVQIKDDNSRALWKVGRISTVIKGSDGQIRVAKVTTSKGEKYTRSIGHLYPLELEESEVIQKDISDPVAEKNQTDIDNMQSTSEAFSCDIPMSTAPADDLHGSNESETPQITAERVNETLGTRPKRASAQRAKEKVKRWTEQLIL